MILVFVMAVVAYGYFSASPDWNSNSRLALVKAVVDEKRFEIDTYHLGSFITMDESFVNGHFYSDKAIGSSLIGMAFYIPIRSLFSRIHYVLKIQAFKELMTFLVISLLSAFLAPLLYSFAKQISNRSGHALLVTAVICFGTAFYKYSTIYYGHTLAGLFLFTVFFIWFNIKNEEKINPLKVLISGYFLGYAIATEYPTVIIVLCLAFYIFYVLKKKHCLLDWKTYIYLIVGMVVPLSLLLIYNAVVFGHPLKTGYSYEVFQIFVEGHSDGLIGIGWPDLSALFYMTFHTKMGIFWQSPVLLLAFVGWFRMWKNSSYQAEALLSFGIVLIYFLVMSGYYIWWGGAVFTPRNVIPVFPFFAIPLVFLTQKWEKLSMILLAIPSIIQMLIVTAASNRGIIAYTHIPLMQKTSFSTMFQDAPTMYAIYFPNFIQQAFEMNRGSEFFHLTGFESLIPLLVVEACLLMIFAVITFKRTEKNIISEIKSHPL
jgi:hypothetical protein